MQIPDCLVWLMGDGCTAVKVYCEKELQDSIAARFTEVFNEEYEELMDLIEEEEGDCNEKEEGINPFNGAQVRDYGVFLPFGSLAMYCEYGDQISWHNAGEALEKALKIIKNEYPAIRYEGYVAYSWSDVHGGEVCQYEISSEKRKKREKNDMVYDFVGEALREALEDEEVREGLAEELQNADEKEFKQIIRLLHAYSKWIPAENMVFILMIAAGRDGGLAETLQKYADELKAGEDDNSEEAVTDTSHLPEGYAEAMDMFLTAEEISGKKPKRGEIMSSEDTFEIVIERAEAGDAEAKLVAGKYFIANHIEVEIERAVRWIREAAEAGVEEAEEYMNEHSEMFG